MDRIEEYRQIVRRVIQEVADYIPEEEEVRTEVIFDDTLGHYELREQGWRHKRRIHGSLVHIDIHDGKVWVEHDGTNLEIVQDLLDAGIPAQDIVIGFHPPNQRKYTEFAVA
jgi:ketopantoate reductase